MDSSVIREFLVGLGYEVNQTQQREFVRGVEKSTIVVAGLGAALTALVAGTVAAANAMEKFYFASQRSNASARGIQAMQYAVTDLGGSADGALNAIEGIARFMREKPGGESWIHSLGVQTRNANGAMRDTGEILADIGKRLSAMPYYRASQYAKVLGIDEKTLMALRQGVGQFADEYKRMATAIGFDSDRAAKTSHGFMVQLRGLGGEADILGKKFFTTFAETLTPTIEKARRWIEANGARIGRVIDGIVQVLSVFGNLVATVITSAVEIFGELSSAYDKLDPQMQEFIKNTLALAAAWKVLDILFALSPVGIVLALAAAIGTLWQDYKVWKDGGKSLIDWGKWKPEIDAATKGINGLIEAVRTLVKWRQKLTDLTGGAAASKAAAIENGSDPYSKREQGSPLHKFLQSFSYYMGFDPRTGKKIPDQYMTDPGASSGSPLGIRNNNPGNLRTGAGGSFGKYGSPQEGLNALGKQLMLYFNGGSAAAGHQKLQTIRDIISTYAPPSENNTAAYIADISKSLGIDPNAKLNLQDPATMQNLMRGIVNHENGRNPYSSDMYRQATAATASRTLQQTTNINVTGVSDAQAAGKEVARQQNNVNQRAARNLMPATS